MTRTAGFMAPLIRALIYGSVFVAFLLVFLPARVLEWSGVVRPEVGAVQVVGATATAAGAVLMLWCVLTFVVIGRGTPAPFDPPRRLVVRGPYAFVRNPMIMGGALALTGASLFFESLALLGYAALFLLIARTIAVSYEEPTLRRMFGGDYEDYRRSVGRWLPRRSAYRGPR